MLVINFNQKINYNIFVLVFSPFFSSFRHFYRFMAHSFLIHALYLLSSTIQKTHKFCWFFLSLLIISHGISVFKTIINKWLCQPAYKPNEWYTYINTINSFFSIRLKYILIGFLRLYDQIDHDLEAFKWKSLTFLTSIGIGSIGAIELRANNSIAVRNGDIGVFVSVGRSSNLLWRFYLFIYFLSTVKYPSKWWIFLTNSDTVSVFIKHFKISQSIETYISLKWWISMISMIPTVKK